MDINLTLPGAVEFDGDLKNRLLDKKAGLDPDYKPRTCHLDSFGWAKFTNRLFLETSPYLLQHAHNPVNWFPWGNEAFDLAVRLNRPILISIGYSTCHWCHVMEEESFEDEEIAEYINQNYVAIKVDREERPDVDSVYMSAIQLLNGNGGWPLNVWLSPENKRPFWGGTYFPARDGDRGASTGFLTILKSISRVFAEDPSSIERSGNALTDAIEKSLMPKGGEAFPDKKTIDNAIDHFKKNYDEVNGGLIGAPKFPSSLPIRLLLRHHHRTGDSVCLSMAENTLTRMARGGIHDHVGGGFHRYTVDDKWLVPHFEKMLYDNALLVIAYLEAFQITGNHLFQRTVDDILEFVDRDMRSPEGGFYSAMDADSLTPEGRRQEGFYFTWAYDELVSLLSSEEMRIASEYWSIPPNGNFEGRIIFERTESESDVAKKLGLEPAELNSKIKSVCEKLLKSRNQRNLPITDTKILVAWNGLMISAYARAGFAFSNEDYIQIAVKAAEYIEEHMLIEGRLNRLASKDNSVGTAYLEDYAFFAAALIDLFEATGEIRWLELAIQMDEVLKDRYEDPDSGAFFTVSNDGEKLIAAEKPFYDGATPSGNSIALSNLLRLGGYTLNKDYISRFESGVRGLLGENQNPLAVTELLLAIDAYYNPHREIVILTHEDTISEADAYLDIIRSSYFPLVNRVVTEAGDAFEQKKEVISVLNHKQLLNDQTTVYVCENGTCHAPVTSVKDFISQL